jgi:hypothetical protein
MPFSLLNRSRAAAAVGVCLALAAYSAAGCGSSGSGSTTSTAPPRGGAPGRLPVYFDLGQRAVGDAALRDDSLDQIAALGDGQVRLVVAWNAVAPATKPDAGFRASDPAAPGYGFGVYDDFMRAAAERGLKVLVTVSGPAPAWATTADGAPEVGPFGKFARAVASRFSGHFDPGGGALPGASLWSVWNEPNLSLFLVPQYRGADPYSPILYRELYLAAQRSIEAADPGTPLLIGETAPTGSTDSVDPILFAEGVLCLTPASQDQGTCRNGGHIDAIGWSTHPYGTEGQAPFQPPPRQGLVTLPSLANLESVLDRAADAGQVAQDLPVYITEYGVQSLPDPLMGVPQQTQADYLSIAEYLAYADPRIHSFAQYLMFDDPPNWVPGQRYGGFESGLRAWNGPAKPSLASFRLPLVVRRTGARVSLWGLVRPSTGKTEAKVQVLDGGLRRDLRTVHTDAAGIFRFGSTFKQGRLWRLAWRDPKGVDYHGPWTPSHAFALPAGDR